jgi:hydrogenase maturation protein HypF
VRRARGFVPEPFALPAGGPPVLAVGGELKSTLCLTRDREAILSQHVGDLDALETRDFFAETERKLAALAGVEPIAIAHDLHPDFHSTRWARSTGLPLEPVQHHHAHVASCLVEHGRTGPVLGVVLDGTGLGPDGVLWGGELLLADLAGFRRLAHLRALPLAGGECAIRQPWRLAAAALADAHEPLEPLHGRFAAGALASVASLLEAPAHAPLATGAGRWFDAVGVLCGLTGYISYEGQVAIELEALAAPGEHGEYPFNPAERDSGLVEADLRPTIQAIAEDLRRGVPAPIIAARFHRTLAGVVAVWCARAVAAGAPRTVVLSGGCFQNRRLTELVTQELARLEVEVLLHRRVPCNDGGLALGQAAIAAFRLARNEPAPCA